MAKWRVRAAERSCSGQVSEGLVFFDRGIVDAAALEHLTGWKAFSTPPRPCPVSWFIKYAQAETWRTPQRLGAENGILLFLLLPPDRETW